ncbi:molybdenum cofactor biosynthesis protein MoaC [candidate division MSBL1 archaeon SCGC-AAA259I09]|uniref:Molybdenum cofactor biosynthesis protein MoaC n=3 Tax=candidate division MSBL1 TaxID=215777 RepID=A0A133UUK8_9EURY|nr:molybdenum cofactor biosynthesis protein MoaC [candidate division MSBL1 archaeon SCGC-AAA259B11]KXA96753.1 molybdenum cofactor biosynthesis protein MoaC [candidate division MSBL1 archaeon SCGC-AAA259I09]KXA97820.1 molybdenum cofactor biosynthesis protein MoaC [candidate division MSBL1 archaeon SCGC-AAA259I14]
MSEMVDIGGKEHVNRIAKASGFIKLHPETIQKIKGKQVPKGDVISVAKTAGIMAIKNTTQIVPLTHPIPITGAKVNFVVQEEGVKVKVKVKSRGQTGVEMEALSGATASLLTVWDMVKGFEKDEEGQYPDTRITDIQVKEKVKK